MPRRAAAAPVLEPEHHGRVTRPARPARRALTASARRVKLDDRKAVKAAAARQEWQEEAWAYFDEIPEVKFAILFVANIMSKLRLYAAAYPPDAPPEAKPIPVSDPASGVSPALAAAATAELARLRSSDGGLADILARLALNLDVAGECHLVGFAATDEEPEEWLIASTSELTEKAGRLAILSQPDDKAPRVLDPEKDTAVRLWYKHGRWSGLADSHVRGVVSTCKTLDLLNRQVDAESLSYLPAGILAVPSEVEGRPASPVAEGAEAGEDPAPADPFLADLEEALIAPVEESGSPAAMVPLVVRAPAEALKELRHIALTRSSAAYLDGRIDRYINRLARGLYVPVEVIMGHMATTFANAAQVDRDTWEDYLEPRAATIAAALTHVFLRPNLVDSRAADPVTASRIVVWWDETACVTQPNKAEHAADAHDRLAISDAAYRAAVHFGEEDAPDEDERAERLARAKGTYPVELTAALLARWAAEAGVALPGTEAAPAEPEAPAAPAAEPGSSFLDIANAVQKVYLGVGVVLTVEEARDIINAAGANLGPPPPELLEAAGEAPPAEGDTPAIPVPPVAGAAGRRLRRTNAGEKLAAIDRELRARLLVAANAAMTRALEKANARVRSRANGQRAALARVHPLEVAATLGPSFVAAATEGADLFEGAWDDLERQYLEWGGVAQRDALDIAGRVAGGFTLAQRAELGLRQAGNLREGWSWLKEGMTSLAGDRLFDPHPQAPALGEWDPVLKVPPGAIRQSIAIAGGAPLQTTDGRSAFLTVGTAGGNIGGIGTGSLIGDALREHGASIEAYRWVYGPAQRQRPFLPHLRLDGVEFRNFDDPALANNHGFPSSAFFIPGDHAGCICDVEPIILAPEDAIARGLASEEEVAAMVAPAEAAAPEAVGTSGPVDPPVVRPPAVTGAERAAEKWGVTVADVETARKQLPAYKAWVRAEAARVRAEAIATLDRADALIMDRPLKGSSIERALGKRGKLAGEYDWLEGLHPDEVKRLRRGFRGDNVGGYGPDNIADRLRQAGLVQDEALGIGGVIEEVWLPLNRQIDAMGAMARGKLPVPNAYGSFDVDSVLGLTDDAGLEWKPSILLDDADDAAGYIARQWRDVAEEEARRTLGMSRYGGFVAEYGPAPWRMSFDSFADEVQELLYTVDNVPGEAAFASARLRELLPDLLDTGQDLASLYDDIIATARLAGEDVAEWVEVY